MTTALKETMKFVFENIGKEDTELLKGLLMAHKAELRSIADDSWHMEMIRKVESSESVAEMTAIENNMAERRHALREVVEGME